MLANAAQSINHIEIVCVYHEKLDEVIFFVSKFFKGKMIYILLLQQDLQDNSSGQLAEIQLREIIKFPEYKVNANNNIYGGLQK